MDINLARTFLEVLASGSFGAAAERLHLTQTAVSARIRALEDQLGRRLFVRNKAGARLTPASSTCWAGAESWTSLTENRAGAGYAACLMPQTSCHASKARVRSAR